MRKMLHNSAESSSSNDCGVLVRSDLSALLSHFSAWIRDVGLCFSISERPIERDGGLFMENNNTFVPTFLLTVCSRKNCGNVWTGIWRLVERQVSTATKTGLGTSTEEQRLPLLDLNFFTEEPAVSINTHDGRTEAMLTGTLPDRSVCDDTKTIGYSNVWTSIRGYVTLHFRDRCASQLRSVTETASQWLFLAL